MYVTFSSTLIELISQPFPALLSLFMGLEQLLFRIVFGSVSSRKGTFPRGAGLTHRVDTQVPRPVAHSPWWPLSQESETVSLPF